MPDDRFRGLAEGAVKEGSLSIDLSELTDQEIVAICDYRAALRRARRRLERSLTQVPHVGPALTECARVPATRGSAFEYFWRSRDARFADRLAQVRRTLDRGGPASPVKVFVYGHRHLADNGFVPVRGAESPIVINSGAWQRTVTPFQVEELMKTRGAAEGEVLGQLQPEDLPACYGVAWIDPYVDRPNPRFRFWRGDGRWGGLARDAAGIGNACGEDCGSPVDRLFTHPRKRRLPVGSHGCYETRSHEDQAANLERELRAYAVFVKGASHRDRNTIRNAAARLIASISGAS